MFRFIDRFFGWIFSTSKKVEDKIIDPWTRGCSYVKMFRNQLELVAELLSNSARKISVKFIPEVSLVEFMDNNNMLIARITMTGEAGIPGTMEIFGNFSDDEKKLFTENIPKDAEYPQYIRYDFRSPEEFKPRKPKEW